MSLKCFVIVQPEPPHFSSISLLLPVQVSEDKLPIPDPQRGRAGAALKIPHRNDLAQIRGVSNEGSWRR